MTLLELFAQAYLTPQEIAIEARLPVETIYAMRKGEPVPEYAVLRVLRVVSARLGRTVQLSDVEVRIVE